jgi:hypothetical protein
MVRHCERERWLLCFTFERSTKLLGDVMMVVRSRTASSSMVELCLSLRTRLTGSQDDFQDCIHWATFIRRGDYTLVIVAHYGSKSRQRSVDTGGRFMQT